MAQTVTWRGRQLPALVRALARRGVVVAARGGALAVCHAPRPPLRGPGGCWLWIAPPSVGTDDLVAATLAGALDAIALGEGPAAVDHAAARIAAALAAEEMRELGPAPSSPLLVAQSARMQATIAQVWRAAQTSMPVLLTGETGTGKEVVAHLIHQWSRRAKKPLVAINCAAIPNELMEAELFGYAKGAFSGAVSSYGGRLLHAEGGTVFLDEVDDTPFAFQVKLLRVLEDRVVSRLGDDAETRVDFRLVAATNRDLRALVESGELGEDLYERLAIVNVELPPLRERREDIPPLVLHFIDRFYEEEPAARALHQVKRAAPEALAVLARKRWPGNVRELRNTIYAALVHKRGGDELLLADLPHRALVADAPHPERAGDAIAADVRAGGFDLLRALEDIERRALAAALEASSGNATQAALLLGRVGRGASADPGATVRAMAKRLGLAALLRSRA